MRHGGTDAAVSLRNRCAVWRDRCADVVLTLALLALPADGTVLGLPMPYWSPISPPLFALYALLHVDRLPWTLRRFPAVAPMALLLTAVSAFGWITVGIDPTHLAQTGMALLFAFAELMALSVAFTPGGDDVGGETAFPAHRAVTIVLVAYGAAFAFGVFTWLAQPGHCDWPGVRRSLMDLFLRQYFAVRPQFLFAEPSYIGMHLFGVLLPLFWLTRERRLLVLLGVFAAGSMAMGCGARILLDTAVAAMLALVVAVPWRRVLHRPRHVVMAVVGLAAATGGMVGALLLHPRFHAIAVNGLFSGDASMSARLFRSLAPLEAGLHDPLHLLFGFGAGNLGTAMTRGAEPAMGAFLAQGGTVTAEIAELRDPLAPTANRAGNVFTMDLYASFLAEFGILALLLAVVLLMRHVTRWHAWSKVTVCWLLLLVYLYAQFEAYAFYALPLFLWATAGPMAGRSSVPSIPSVPRHGRLLSGEAIS